MKKAAVALVLTLATSSVFATSANAAGAAGNLAAKMAAAGPVAPVTLGLGAGVAAMLAVALANDGADTTTTATN